MIKPAATPPSMRADIRAIYTDTLSFVRAVPLLFFVPVLAEGNQHVAEWQLGFYTSMTAARALSTDPALAGWGILKIVGLILPTWWMVRYTLSGRNAAYARQVERPAIVWRGSLALVTIALTSLTLLNETLHIGAALGLSKASAKLFGYGVDGLVMIFSVLLLPTIQGLAIGRWVAPARSVRAMVHILPAWFVLLIASVGPLMVVHYVLSLGAIGRSAPLAVMMLVLDAFIVGFLALTMAAGNAIVARRAVPDLDQTTAVEQAMPA